MALEDQLRDLKQPAYLTVTLDRCEDEEHEEGVDLWRIDAIATNIPTLEGILAALGLTIVEMASRPGWQPL